jgi:hypothetical protein
MKALTLALLLSLPVPKITPPPQAPVEMAVRPTHHKGGKWYFAANGHAVYCYGPVMYVTEPMTGGLQRVATFCQNDQPMVPLKD